MCEFFGLNGKILIKPRCLENLIVSIMAQFNKFAGFCRKVLSNLVVFMSNL